MVRVSNNQDVELVAMHDAVDTAYKVGVAGSGSKTSSFSMFYIVW